MTLQEIIHFIEVGAGKKYLRYILPVLAIMALAILYDFRCWRNFSAPEAMDSAQLARNISAGKGYTTLFVRPLSIYLVQQKNEGKGGAWPQGNTDYAQLKTPHPDLANAPVYPLALAGLMKILPFHFAVNLRSPFWANNGIFWRYQPEFLIGIFNQVLFVLAALPVFFIARRLFDVSIARFSAVVFLGSEMFWRFSSSGLSTMLLLLIFLAVTWCILEIEALAREPEPDTLRILCWVSAAGILTGVGGLTRYAFGWTIIPIALWVILFGGRKRLFNVLALLATFTIVLAPWVARNLAVSATPFGTAGYAIFSETPLSPEFQLERSMHPDLLGALWPTPYAHKLAQNARHIFQDELTNLGESWVSILFFAGLLLGFTRPAVRRMRYYLVMCLATFIVVQALGRTPLSDSSPEINSENLIILAAPLVFIFGTAFFFILLDQMSLPLAQLRYLVIGVFVLVCCLPLVFALWYKTAPVIYPPYYPPDIERMAGWMRPDEMMMSDQPWAVAWYGQRQCAWLTLDDANEFFALNDYIKPVSGLYLSLGAMDGRLVTDCFRGGKDSWASFVLSALSRNQIPSDFPLHHSPTGSATVSSGMFLTDADRWQIAAPSP